MRLKRWESPRREGRNDKGKGGSARKRQLKKQRQMLRQRLKEGNSPESNHNKKRGRQKYLPLFLLWAISKLVGCVVMQRNALSLIFGALGRSVYKARYHIKSDVFSFARS